MRTGPAGEIAGSYQVGDCTFDCVTGEVSRTSENEIARTTRLAPKPAALLRMLIDKQCELLTIDEIHHALWPDVQVEFDQGVHTCMRQIRAALGDSASNPQYIKTLPRRGYRLMVPAEAIGTENSIQSDVSAKRRNSNWRIGAMILFVALLPLIAALSIGSANKTREPIPLAIMPFEPPSGSTFTDIADVATLLLADFGSDPAFSVIGPSTTIRFASTSEPLVAAISELDVRYIINGRFIRRDDRDQVLVELVRTSDGAHVWVQMYNSAIAAPAISEQVSNHVRNVLLSADIPVS